MTEALSLYWLLPAALWDWRTRRVPNWLVLPGLLLAILFQVRGRSDIPLWMVGLLCLIAWVLWRCDLLGGADAKAWMIFALMGSSMLVGCALGMLIWHYLYPVILRDWDLHPEGQTPGYPAYLIGVGLVLAVKLTALYNLAMAGL